MAKTSLELDVAQSPVPVSEVSTNLIRKCVEACLSPTRIERARTDTSTPIGVDDAVELSVVLVGDEAIHQLNSYYRGKDSATDVLSFWCDLDEPEMSVLRQAGEPLPLGDIYISTERALEQAQEYGHSFDRELAYLCVHGVLHLLGYDHEDEASRSIMRDVEEGVLGELGLTR